MKILLLIPDSRNKPPTKSLLYKQITRFFEEEQIRNKFEIKFIKFPHRNLPPKNFRSGCSWISKKVTEKMAENIAKYLIQNGNKYNTKIAYVRGSYLEATRWATKKSDIKIEEIISEDELMKLKKRGMKWMKVGLRMPEAFTIFQTRIKDFVKNDNPQLKLPIDIMGKFQHDSCEKEIEKLRKDLSILKEEKKKEVAAADNQLKEIKKRLLYVDALRKLLERIALSLDTKQIMEAMIEALNMVVRFNSLSYVVVRHMEGGPSVLYTYTKTPVGRIYFSTVKKELIAFAHSISDDVKNRVLLISQLRGKVHNEFIVGGVDEKRGVRPIHSFILPLIVREKKDGSTVIGIFYIASILPGQAYSEEDIKMAEDLASVVAINIERIHTAVRTEYARLSNLVDSMTNGVIVFNQNKVVTLSNPMIEKMTGLPCSSSSSSSSSSMFLLEEFTNLFPEIGLEEIIRKVLKTGLSLHVEEAVLLRSFYELFITPIRDYDQNITGGAIILHDITHQKEISRMESEFISTASHQLRTPMTGIQWVIERFAKTEKLTPKGKEYLVDVHYSLSRLTNLVDVMLNVSRIEGGRISITPKHLDMVEFIKGYLQECEPLCDKNKLVIKFAKHPQKLNVSTDTSAVRNVIQSLVSNAIEYTPPDGKITISLEKKDHHFLFTVSDTGIGIPKEAQSTIFDKFTRAENARLVKTGGTGLGLYTAKQAVNLLDGKIWLESKGEGKGTTFFVELPLESKSRAGEKELS